MEGGNENRKKAKQQARANVRRMNEYNPEDEGRVECGRRRLMVDEDVAQRRLMVDEVVDGGMRTTTADGRLTTELPER